MSAVVVKAPGGARQDEPGLVDDPHSLGGFHRALVQVRMMALCQVPMRLGDLERRRITRDAKDGIGIESSTPGHGDDSTAVGRPSSG